MKTFLRIAGVVAALIPEIASPQPYGLVAMCDGTADDTIAINTYLASLPIGSTVVMPTGKFCLINSGNVQIPAGIRIQGSGGPFQPQFGGEPRGSGFKLNPAYTIIMNGAGSQLANVAIIRAGLTVNPTDMQVKSEIAKWGAEESVAVTIPPNVGGVNLESLFIVGFNRCIASNAGQFSLRTLLMDCYNGIDVTRFAGDTFTISDVKLEPIYAFHVTSATGAWARPGIGLNIYGTAAGAEVSHFFTFMYANGVVVNDDGGVQINNSHFEWQHSIGNGITGTTALRTIGNPTLSSFSDIQITGFDAPVSIESVGETRLVNISVLGEPTGGGPSYYLGGQSAIAAILTVEDTLTPGGTISANFTSASIMGSPVTATYTMGSSDTAATAATGLAQAVNHIQALISAHVSAVSSGAVATFFWPAAMTVVVTNSASGGRSLRQSTARAHGGSAGSIVGAHQVTSGVVPVFQTLVNTGYWQIDTPYFYKPLPSGWLSVASPNNGGITLSGIPWSNISASNLSACGDGSPTVRAGSNDSDFAITTGKSAVGCVLTFTTPFYKAPLCQFTSENGITLTSVVPEMNKVTIKHRAASDAVFVGHCEPH